jgi:uncharacterized protein (TIGR02284 family)
MTTTETLEHLVETFENGQRGYTDGAEKLRKDGHPDLAATFDRLAAERANLASELRTTAGLSSDGMGTAPGSVHRTWLRLKDALSGNDPHAVLAAAEQGEDHAMKEIIDALVDAGLPGSARACVVKAQAEVRAAHDTVKTLRNTATNP